MRRGSGMAPPASSRGDTPSSEETRRDELKGPTRNESRRLFKRRPASQTGSVFLEARTSVAGARRALNPNALFCTFPLKGEAEKYKRVLAEIYGNEERRDSLRCAQGHVTFLSLKELKAFLFPMKKKIKKILQICIFSSVLPSRSRLFQQTKTKNFFVVLPGPRTLWPTVRNLCF